MDSCGKEVDVGNFIHVNQDFHLILLILELGILVLCLNDCVMLDNLIDFWYFFGLIRNELACLCCCGKFSFGVVRILRNA